MKGYLTLLALLIVFVAVSCQKSKRKSKAPEILFVDMQPDIVRSASSEDNVFLTFKIFDEDGDLGLPAGQNRDSFDIYLVDSRSKVDSSDEITDTIRFHFPEIPERAQNPSKGTEGQTTVKISAALYLKMRDTVRTRDTLQFEVFVKDQALNTSNRITTPNIYIEP